MAAATPTTVPGFFLAAFERFGDRPILEDRAGTVGLGEVLSSSAALANALVGRGLARGDRVAFWADNSRRWIVVDLAIQLAGGIDVPRGTDTPDDEAREIFAHAETSLAFVHDSKTAHRLEAMRPRLPHLSDVVVLDPRRAGEGGTVDALLAEAVPGPSFAERVAALSADDVATIIYTSGTTGRPKGVALTHANFAHQIGVIPTVLGIGPSDVFLSFLPPWHIFERTVEYVCLTQGARLVYTDVRHLKPDLAARSPTFVPSVPRVWEVVHDTIRKAVAEGSRFRRALFSAAYMVADHRARCYDRARGHAVRPRRPRGLGAVADRLVRVVAGVLALLLTPSDLILRALVFRKIHAITGGRLRGAVVGGGHMPAHVDRFFRAAGLGVLVGYGLTETSPVLTVRRERRNVIGTIGTAIPGVELSIRDRETGKPLPPGEVGVVFTRGPQVMRGYHRDPELTARVLSADGWFDTGDLGMLTEDGDLCFRGRQKETIVLLGGENVEPTRVEERILPSPLVEQAIVVGQDRKTLAALVVPRAEEVRKRLGVPDDLPAAALAARDDVRALLRAEVARATGNGSGLRPFEVVSRVVLLPEAMTPENGLLTATRKPRRHVLAERFSGEIEAVYR